jgi:hypothetical protein
MNQCCGSENFFSDSDPQKIFSESDSDTDSDKDSSDLCFCNCENMCFFSFNSSICHALLPYQIIVSGSVSESEFYLDSDSDPAKSFGFFWIRIQIRIRNTGMNIGDIAGRILSPNP